jgi:hypothetical protein
MPRASWRGLPRLSLVSCPDLFVAGDDTHETHSLAQGVGNQRRSMWTRPTCRIGAEGGRVLRHRYRGSSPTMRVLMETRAPPPPSPRDAALALGWVPWWMVMLVLYPAPDRSMPGVRWRSGRRIYIAEG